MSYTAPIFVVMNKDKWNSLPKDIQEIITQVNLEWVDKQGKQWTELDAESKEFCTQKGIKFVKATPEEEAKTAEKMKPILAEYVKATTAKGLPGDESLQFLCGIHQVAPIIPPSECLPTSLRQTLFLERNDDREEVQSCSSESRFFALYHFGNRSRMYDVHNPGRCDNEVRRKAHCGKRGTHFLSGCHSYRVCNTLHDLDQGTYSGGLRTGEAFSQIPTNTPGAHKICRYLAVSSGRIQFHTLWNGSYEIESDKRSLQAATVSHRIRSCDQLLSPSGDSDLRSCERGLRRKA